MRNVAWAATLVLMCSGLLFSQRPTGTEFHIVYASADHTTIYGQSSLETGAMSIPPGSTIVHTVTASFSLQAGSGTKTVFQTMQSGGPQDPLDPVASGDISLIADTLYYQNLADTAVCNYYGNFFDDSGEIAYLVPPYITGLQGYTPSGQYVAFAPYVDTPQSPAQSLIVYGNDFTADGASNPPTICVNGTCSAGGSISTSGFHLGSGWSATENESTGQSQMNIPYWVDPTASPGSYTLQLTTLGGSSSVSFVVGDASPLITAISPATFTAGTATQGVQISGQHLGTNCQSVAVAPALPNSSFTPTECTDTLVSGTLKLDPSATGTATLTLTAEGYTALGFDPQTQGEAKSASKSVTVIQPTLSISRPALTRVVSSATPVSGTYSWASNLPVAFAPGVNQTTVPNTAQLSNPPNPSQNGAPSAGSLSTVSAWYSPPNPVGIGISRTFHVPVFGMSCYYTTTQEQWGTAPNSCLTTSIGGNTYSGSATNPPGLPAGSYCNSFLAQLRLQGSGTLVNGTDVQYTGSSYYVTSSITGADGSPVVAGRTIARDRTVIPKTPTTYVDINGVGSALLANDTGGAILGYRIDYYGGAGPTACSTFSNLMSISGCNPSNASCPGDNSIQD